MKSTLEEIDIVIYGCSIDIMSSIAVLNSSTGERGAGKGTLAATLQGRTYIRHHDRKAFVLNARPDSDSDSVAGSLGLVAVDATNVRTFPRPLFQHALSTTRTAAIALTKTDLIPRDFSPRHLALLRLGPFFAGNYDAVSFAISATTGEGLEDLISWIVNAFSPITVTHSETLQSLWQKFSCFLLDKIASFFALPNRRLFRDVDKEISEIGGAADIHYLLKGNLAAEWDANLKHRLRAHDTAHVGVHRVTPSLILKESSACGPSECASMEYVLQHTTIPIPRVHRPDLPHLVMDYIEGDMLYECWDRLSRFMQFRVACTLRLYVRQLQNLKHQRVGTLQSGYVGGILFDESLYGPFDSIRRFRRFCEWVVFEGWQASVYGARERGEPIPAMPCSPNDWTPVFTHGDFNPGNVLLGRDGTLWVIDWGQAGFYPSYIETLVMRHNNEVVLADENPPSWKRYRQFIAGNATKEEEDFWGYFHRAIHRFPGTDM